ncbi:MAG: tRNA pseudouridine(55) synthase TruB [Dehalococcoidia bacterium]|nr:tRNA pseudouridine(55) synthase TruB [Dehalococcoidia bacterium]
MRSGSGLTGILLVDKPGGWTSHDVVAKVRGLSGQRRIGHTGTLDPLATGLLVLCLGWATRLVEYMSGHSKRYEGTIVLGQTTDTDDADGSLLAERPVPALAEFDLRRLEAAFSGDIDQVPPAYSAVKIGGTRAYAAARRGKPLSLPARPVTVSGLSLTLLGPTTLGVMVCCSAGTYVRSLARDIGAALGCGAHLASLRRTRVGVLSLEDAWTLADLAGLAAAGGLERALLPADEGLLDRPAAIVSELHARALWHGEAVFPQSSTEAATVLRLYSAAGMFVGAGVLAGGMLRPLKVIAGPAAVLMSRPATVGN